jgi:phosphate starvation-inducible PhoH-like protein
VDLAEGIASGLVEAEAAMGDVAGVKFIRFSRGDVVRHAVVSEIIDAYENYRNSNKNGATRGRGESR